MRPVIAFLSGLAVALAVGLSVLVANNLGHAVSKRNTQICALDRAIVSVLVRSWRNVPKTQKYDKYRTQLAQDIGEIQNASAC